MILAIVGPTGVGKTKMSIALAKKLNGEIINCDSTQIYQEMNIGTAKVTEKEKEGVRHHLFDVHNLLQDYTVYDYQKDARKKITEIQQKGKMPIIVGGSGLYLSALLYNYHFQKEDHIFDLDSVTDQELYKRLMNIHPELEIDKHNRQRLIRAYAKYVYHSKPIEKENDGNKLYYEDAIIIGLTTDKTRLYEIINDRVELMVESGLIQEVRKLYEKYPTAKQLHTTIGYKEIIEYIHKSINLETAISMIKQNSRNYAKRQYTWLNHKMKVNWFEVNYEDFNETINEVFNTLNN